MNSDTKDIPIIVTIFGLYKQQECQDNTDRTEVERFSSRNIRCYGLGYIVTKMEETQLTSIALSVFVSNLFRIQKRILLAFI